MLKTPFAIGPFTLDVQHRTLWRAGNPVALGPKVIDVLIALVERNGEVVSKDELMERVWPNRFVEEGNISQSVHRLRRALSEGGLPNAITTMPGRGYRFTGQQSASLVSVRRTFPFALAACALAILSLFGLAGTPKATPAFERLSLESQQQYRLGLYHLNLRSDVAHIERSVQDFAAVAHRDPTNPLGYAGLADAYLSLYDAQCDASPRNCVHIVEVARANALKAVAVDARSAEAHTALAMTLNELENDIAGSEREFRRAIALDPAYPLAHHWYGNLLTVDGHFQEAMVQHTIALRLDPTSPSTYAWLAHDAFFSRNYAAAIRFAQRSDDLYPMRHPMRVLAALSYERLGQTQQALYSLKYLNAIEAQALRAAVYAGQGRRSTAVALLRPITLAQARSAGATAAMAFAWMAVRNDVQAYAYMRSTPIPNRVERNFLAYDPRWNGTRDRARFAVWMTPH